MIKITLTDYWTETVKEYQACGRCGGNGKIACYSHIDNGICFKCGGTGEGDSKNKTLNYKADKDVDCWEFKDGENFEDVLARREKMKNPSTTFEDLFAMFENPDQDFTNPDRF